MRSRFAEKIGYCAFVTSYLRVTSKSLAMRTRTLAICGRARTRSRSQGDAKPLSVSTVRQQGNLRLHTSFVDKRALGNGGELPTIPCPTQTSRLPTLACCAHVQGEGAYLSRPDEQLNSSPSDRRWGTYQACLEQRTPCTLPRLPTLACREVENTHRRWNILASTLSASRRNGTSHRAPTLQAHILWCLPHPVTFGAVSLLSVSANVLHSLQIDGLLAVLAVTARDTWPLH